MGCLKSNTFTIEIECTQLLSLLMEDLYLLLLKLTFTLMFLTEISILLEALSELSFTVLTESRETSSLIVISISKQIVPWVI